MNYFRVKFFNVFNAKVRLSIRKELFPNITVGISS